MMCNFPYLMYPHISRGKMHTYFAFAYAEGDPESSPQNIKLCSTPSPHSVACRRNAYFPAS